MKFSTASLQVIALAASSIIPSAMARLGGDIMEGNSQGREANKKLTAEEPEAFSLANKKTMDQDNGERKLTSSTWCPSDDEFFWNPTQYEGLCESSKPSNMAGESIEFQAKTSKTRWALCEAEHWPFGIDTSNPDREYTFSYCKPEGASWETRARHQEIMPLSTLTGDSTYDCPPGSHISGVVSTFDDTTQDRQFQFYCAKYDSFDLVDCSTTYDFGGAEFESSNDIEYSIGKVFVGYQTIYSSELNTRIIGFKKCGVVAK